MRKTTFIIVLTLIGVLLFGCEPRTVENESQGDTPSGGSSGTYTPELPAPSPGEGTTSALMAPYEISDFVNMDLIFLGEIISVENVSSVLTYKGEVQGSHEESLLTVRVIESYSGKLPDGKKEIILYCPVSNENSDVWGLALSPGRSYVFFAMNWDEYLISEFAKIGYDEYGYDKRSDAYLPGNSYSMFIAKDGLVFAQAEWAEIVPPTYAESLGERQDYSSIKKEYGAKEGSYLAGLASIYSEKDFKSALDKLQKLY